MTTDEFLGSLMETLGGSGATLVVGTSCHHNITVIDITLVIVIIITLTLIMIMSLIIIVLPVVLMIILIIVLIIVLLKGWCWTSFIGNSPSRSTHLLLA